MLRGCQKKIIVLKNTGSAMFDEAYFILNDDAAASAKISHGDMVSEANRIIDNCAERDCGDADGEQKRLWQIFMWFSLGAVCSAAVTALIMLI